MDISLGLKKQNRTQNRKRATGRNWNSLQPITAAVTQPNLQPPVMGCSLDKFKDKQPIQEDDLTMTRQEKKAAETITRQKMKTLPQLSIEGVSFNLMSYEEIEAMSIFTVDNTDDSGYRSVNDPRSGVVDNNSFCKTCDQNSHACPGHFGMIKLNVPIIHPLFMGEVINVL